MEPKEIVNDEVVVEDIDDGSETELDKSINDTISRVRAEAGQEPIPPTVETSTETPSAEVVPPPVKEETPIEEASEAIDLTTPPKKGKFESDDSYNMRLNLFDLIKARKAAQTPAEKDAIQEQMKALRTEIGDLSRAVQKPSLSNNNDDAPQADPEKKPPNSADIDAIVDQRLIARQTAIEIRSVTESFFEKHPVFKDPDVRDVFIDFVDSNYKIEGKSSKEVAVVLDLARQAMFRPNETVQERVLKSAGVQEKVNAMQFPGGTIVKPGVTPEEQKSIDEIVATGMSEAKARQLILDN